MTLEESFILYGLLITLTSAGIILLISVICVGIYNFYLIKRGGG